MGFLSNVFSKIGKAIKSVFTGILNVFAPILKPLGKLLNSSLGKIIMIGLSIFTLGTAMVAGFQAFSGAIATNQGFISAFVEGGKAFMTSLTGIGGEEAAKQGANSAAEAAASQTSQINVGESLMGASTKGAEVAGSIPNVPTGGGGWAGGGNLAGAKDAAQAATNAAQTGAGWGGKVAASASAPTNVSLRGVGVGAGGGVEAGHWLSKAAKAGGDFVKATGDFIQTPGGGNIAGKLIEGAGNYYTSKDQQEFDDRIRRQWGDSNDPGVRGLRQSADEFAQVRAPSAQGVATGSSSALTTRGGNRRVPFASANRQPVPTGG